MTHTVKVGPITYTIKRTHDLKDGKDLLFGKVTHAESLIELDASLDPQASKQTLWHEIFHVIRVQSGLPYSRTEEQIIEAFTYGLLAVIQDNPWILQELDLSE